MPAQPPRERLTIRIPVSVRGTLQAIADVTGEPLATVAADKLTAAVLQDNRTDLLEDFAELHDEIDELRATLASHEQKLAAKKRKRKSPPAEKPGDSSSGGSTDLGKFFDLFVEESLDHGRNP